MCRPDSAIFRGSLRIRHHDLQTTMTQTTDTIDSLHIAGPTYHVSADELSRDMADRLREIGAPGDATHRVTAFMRRYCVTGDPDDVRDMLSVTGGWEDSDLCDHAVNVERAVWLIGCDIAEHGKAYLTTY